MRTQSPGRGAQAHPLPAVRGSRAVRAEDRPEVSTCRGAATLTAWPGSHRPQPPGGGLPSRSPGLGLRARAPAHTASFQQSSPQTAPGEGTGPGVAPRFPVPGNPAWARWTAATPPLGGRRSLSSGRQAGQEGAGPALGPARSPRLQPESGPGHPQAVRLEGLLEAIPASSSLCCCRQPWLVAASAQSPRPVVSPCVLPFQGQDHGTEANLLQDDHLPRPYFQTRPCGRELGCPCSARSSRTCRWPTGLTLGSWGPGTWALDPAGALMRIPSTEGPL